MPVPCGAITTILCVPTSVYVCKKQNVTVQVVDLACGDVAVADFLFANGTVFTRQHCLRCKPRVTTVGVSFLSFSKHPSTACAQCLFTGRSELRKVLLLTLSMTFLFVYEISREPLNGFAPNSQEGVFGPLLGRV